MNCRCGKIVECNIPEPFCRECATEYYSLLLIIGAAHHERFEFPEYIFRWSPRENQKIIKHRFEYIGHPCYRCKKLNITPPRPISNSFGRLCKEHLYESHCMGRRKSRENKHPISTFEQAS